MLKLSNETPILQKYLESRKWLQVGEEVVKAEIPGEGNMNFTLRILTNKRSFIIKQSREYVEKYPQVAAPRQRALREAEFYALIKENTFLSAMTPNLLDIDEENCILIMEDLGHGTDYSFLYQAEKVISEHDLTEIIDFAITLHRDFTIDKVKNPIRNREMRKLNHEHMVHYPYMEENGLNLDDLLPGLKNVATQFKKNEKLKKAVIAVGEIYLEDGRCLLHGDYFPGSWMKTQTGMYIIDPEFCFFGAPEFEIGVTIAHLMMADQPYILIEQAMAQYLGKVDMDDDLRKRFTATEILRRIMGLAQLPLTIDLNKRKELLEYASETLLS